MFFFGGKTEENPEKGLCVSLEELIAEQNNLPYVAELRNRPPSNRAGDVKSAFKGRGMELEEVRAYAFGDDVRDIDWRITARKSEPFTKVYNEEKDRIMTVVLDMSPSMVFGTRRELKAVSAAKIAALLGWMSLRNKDRFGLLIYDGKETSYFKPQGSIKGLMAMFNKIAAVSRQILTGGEYATGGLGEALKVLQYNQKGQGTVFILSDFYHFGSEEFKNVAALAGRHKVYCLHIFDVLEEIAPESGVYPAEYDGQKIIFNSGTAAFKHEYRQYFAQNRENIKKNCQKFLCGYAEIRTDKPVFKQLSLL